MRNARADRNGLGHGDNGHCKLQRRLLVSMSRDLRTMDLKPSNMLISAQFKAVLGDISGMGGVTRDYLALEMLDITDPLAEARET